jgi:hypothetical protein
MIKAILNTNGGTIPEICGGEAVSPRSLRDSAGCSFGLPATLSSRGVTALHPPGNPAASASLRRDPVRSRAQRHRRSANDKQQFSRSGRLG